MPSPQREFTTYSIGEVLSLVKKDFPDVTISKIRFLETEGLITPARTPSGYRRFTQNDVDRLVAVLTMQRDQYLPLKIIRENLDASSEPQTVAASGGGLSALDFRPNAGRLRLTRGELAEQAGMAESDVVEMEKIGLVWVEPAGHYTEDALTICLLAVRLRQFGMETRHLKSFKVVTDRESGLIEQMATPFSQPRDKDAQARAVETVRELASLMVQMHAALLRADLIRSGLA